MTSGVTRGLEPLGPMSGLTCAACHVGELHYQGKRVRIDGAPNLLNTREFFITLIGSAVDTAKDPARLIAFVAKVHELEEKKNKTPPYLHNGSVPTLHDLILPAKDRPLSPCPRTSRPMAGCSCVRQVPAKIVLSTSVIWSSARRSSLAAIRRRGDDPWRTPRARRLALGLGGSLLTDYATCTDVDDGLLSSRPLLTVTETLTVSPEATDVPVRSSESELLGLAVVVRSVTPEVVSVHV